jgi:hypothetical protein
LDKLRNNFDFFRIFAEIFDYFCASPVSVTPVSDAIAVLDCGTSVNDIAEEFVTSVNDTLVKPSFTGVNDTAKF